MGVPTIGLADGHRIPVLGLGTWPLRGGNGYRTIRGALELGYRHLDTATAYGNESDVGRALRDAGVPPSDVFVTTKLPAQSADRARETLERSLDALALPAVDLWLIHAPPGGRARPDTWSELLAARHDGLARSVGVSNYGIGLLDELAAATGEAPAVNQVPWGPSRYDAALLAAHRERGIVLEGYGPLKNADLAHPDLLAIARAHGVSAAQVALRWHVEHGVVAIPKSSRPERLAANLDVFGFGLSRQEIARIDRLRIPS
jgi:2,5-diketo-D-gluconate reductase A